MSSRRKIRGQLALNFDGNTKKMNNAPSERQEGKAPVPSTPRWIAHFDMDSFFASIEQRDNEEYRGKPVIVGGLSARGVVATASYEARKFGVHSAMPMETARRRCPNAIFLPPDFKRYRAASRQIFALMESFSPIIEPLSIDEGFLDISGMEHIVTNLPGYGRRIKKAVFDETGLIASVGIAPNKFLAKLASDLEKPDGLTLIRREDIPRVLWPLPVSRLWGVGKKTADRLMTLRYRRIGDIANADPERLIGDIGERLALHLYELANGRDNRPVEPVREAQSIGREITFEEDITTREAAESQLLYLAEQVGWRLRRAGREARTIQIKIRFKDFSTYTRQKTLDEAVCYDEDIYRIAIELFRAFPISPSVGIRLLGISGSGFDEPAAISLFNAHDDKKEKLYTAIDDLKQRFGENIVRRGTQH